MSNYNKSSEEPLLPTEEITGRNRNIKKIVVSGVGFFSDAYDLFIINIVMLILARDFSMSSSDKSMVSAAALWGAVCGQLGFGLVADKIGRKKGFVITLSMVILGAIASACSFETAHTSVFVSLTLFRLFLGVGIGGEYPLSATITAESSKTHERGRMTALVFSMQGVGSLVASLTGFIFLTAMVDTSLPESDSHNKDALNIIWRLCLGLGAVPGVLTMYSRVTMEETERFVLSKTAESPVVQMSLAKKVSTHLIETAKNIKPHWKSLIGCAGSWFLFDIVFYANGLFSATLLQLFAGKTTTSSPVETTDKDASELLGIAQWNIYLALIALPGYWAGVFLIETPFFARRNTQIIGFIALALLYFIIGISFKQLEDLPGLFIVLYGLTFFFSNAGPNTTTFVLPSESFPTKVRATCHGLSAAAGKVGAALGAGMMAPILDAYGIPPVLYICSIISILGAILTYFFITETRGLSLEQVTNDSDVKTVPTESPQYNTTPTTLEEGA